jgi:glucose/mannose transport system permease protein
MAVPAVLLSTAWGALNGYVLSMWCFRGSELLFGLLLFGVFMPFQVVLLPMSTRILMVTLIWQFTNIWNDFLFGVAFSGADSKPITVGLNNMANTSNSVKNYNVDMAAAMVAGLPTMLVYVLAGQYVVKGLMAGAVKG